MEFHEYKIIISALKSLKSMLEEETKPEGEKKEMYSFGEDGKDINMNVSFNMSSEADKYIWEYPIGIRLFRKYFFPVLNKHKNEIIRDMISCIQEDARKEKEDLFVQIGKLVEDFSEITK